MNDNNIDEEKLNNKEKEPEKEENKDKDDNDNDIEDEIIIKGETLSNTRINITFSDMNESNMGRETYKSIPFQHDNLDLDIPNFSPPRYKKSNWKIMHSCSCFLFALFFGISIAFISMVNSSTYKTLLIISHIFLVISTLVEWSYFKRGCIGESNLNSKLKSNIDQSFKAKILRSEYGLKYGISLFASIILLLGDIIYQVSNELNISSYQANIILIYFNIFGMMSLALAQIMKIDKILNEDNKMSYVQNDFSKSIFEILFFFASLLDGGLCILQLFNMHISQSPLFILHLIIKILAGLLFFASSIILIFNYFCSDYCKISSKKYRRL